MNALLLVIGTAFVPTATISLATGRPLAAVLGALLVLCALMLWLNRERRAPAAKPAAPRRPRRAGRRFGHLTPSPRPAS
jgi:L-lactate permease